MSVPAPQQFRDRALAAERSGNMAEAATIFASAMAAHPADAHLANSAANLAMRMGNFTLAEQQFAAAARIAPNELEFGLNRAIALSRAGRDHEAIAVLEQIEPLGRSNAKYCSARGTAERSVGNLANAARWYENALAIDPRHPRALQGRARVAIEQGEADAPARFERALAVTPADADLWLGRAQSLDVAGEVMAAREIAETLVQQAPHWAEGLRFLAQLKLAAGDPDFADHYADAARKMPQDAGIAFGHISALADTDRFAEACEVAAAARQRFGQMEQFALLEAINAGSAGDDERAQAVFQPLQLDTPDRFLHEARHRIRRGEFDIAEQMLGRVLAADPWNISPWALLGIVWRLKDDPRAQWLHEQAGLVCLLPLVGAHDILPDAIPLLHQLHDGSPLPLGQSLRGGTQTRGRLFDRTEEPLARLHSSLLQTLENYRAGLTARDDRHPLLRHRETPWKLAGSWSVRLDGGGDYHTSHIHPQGILSSALYLEFPPAADDEDQEGWLEIGRPPPDLRLDLPPIKVIRPRPGHLALFPSTLYHGTRPFSSGRRMTVAFDVTVRERP